MRRPTLKQLNALVTVLETGHFGEAARRLNLTQPTLSQQIRTLEDNLGGPLIDRAGVRSTPLGEEVARRARTVLRDVEDLVDAARSAQRDFGGLVRLGVLPTVGPYLLPPLLADLHARHPALRLHVREDRPAALMAGLHDGRHDALLTALPSGMEGATERPLLVDPIRLGVSRDHPLAAVRTVARDALAGQPMLTLGRGHPLHEATETLAQSERARVLTEFEGSSLDAIRQMVATGLGVALFPDLYVRSEIARVADVVTLELAPPLARTVGMVWRGSSPRALQIEALAEEIAGALAPAGDGKSVPRPA